MNRKKNPIATWLFAAGWFFASVVREFRHVVLQTCLFTVDLFKMVDINDFGRYISKNLGKRFLALSGVVTLFALVGDYTKRVVYGEASGVVPTANILENLIANFLFFGVPGGILLLSTQLFTFFNRSNYFTAQANYLNLLETRKRTPAQLEEVIDKLWEHVYASEYAIHTQDRSQDELCQRVREIQRINVTEQTRLVAGICAGGEDHGETAAAAKEKYEAYMQGTADEGYLRYIPWEGLSLIRRCNRLEGILEEETVTAIAREHLFYCEEGFKLNAGWALSHPMHLNIKHQKTGIDLKMVEDWLDGAFCDLTDTKLIEQYIAEATIKSAKIQARVPVIRFIMKQGIRTFMQRIWTFMALGITSKRIGRYLNHLNHQFVKEESDLFDRDYFKAEAFFWRSEAYDREIAREIGEEALTRLQTLRARWIFLTLGRLRRPRVHPDMTRERLEKKLEENTERAIRNGSRLVKRMFAGSVYNIHELRLRYDPDYVIQMADRNFTEFDRMGLGTNYIKRHRRWVMRSARKIQEILPYLEKLLDPKEAGRYGHRLKVDEEARRALRVAYHINEKGMRTLAARDRARGFDPSLRMGIYQIVQDVVERKRTYSRKIRQLKIFETLAINHLRSYIKPITRLYQELQHHYLQELERRLERRRAARKG